MFAGGPNDVKITSWVKRLEIAEDAAKGLSQFPSDSSTSTQSEDSESLFFLHDESRYRVSPYWMLSNHHPQRPEE
jgi:hypothetical protein